MMEKIFRIFLFIIAVLSKQLILVKEKDEFVFKLNIANLKINLKATISLQNQKTWIKSEQCKYCRRTTSNKKQTDTQNIANIQKFQDNLYDCSQSCFDKSQEQYGLKCVQTNKKCQVIKENQIFNFQKNTLKAKLIKLKAQAQTNNQKFQQLQIFLVQRIFRPQQQSNPQKDHQQQLQPYFPSQLGYYSIWADGSLFENNLITKNTQNQIVVYDDTKENSIQKQLLDILPIQISLQQTETQLTLSQIKLTEKILLNHPQTQTDDFQIPIFPLQKGFFTLQTENLILPKKQYQKLTKRLLETYFSQEGNICDIKDKKVSCSKSISLDKVNYLELSLILNGASVQFPLTALLKNCKGKSCDLRIQVGQSDQTFRIGWFLFEVFAIELVKDTENIRLHRLDNQWNQFYSRSQKFHKENLNIFWWMGTSVFYIIFYALKILFYLALFSLLINCIYNWRRIVQWIAKILDRIRKKNRSKQTGGQLFEEDEDLYPDTSKLIKKIKTRKTKVFVQDQTSINDEVTTQSSS